MDLNSFVKDACSLSRKQLAEKYQMKVPTVSTLISNLRKQGVRIPRGNHSKLRLTQESINQLNALIEKTTGVKTK